MLVAATPKSQKRPGGRKSAADIVYRGVNRTKSEDFFAEAESWWEEEGGAAPQKDDADGFGEITTPSSAKPTISRVSVSDLEWFSEVETEKESSPKDTSKESRRKNRTSVRRRESSASNNDESEQGETASNFLTAEQVHDLMVHGPKKCEDAGKSPRRSPGGRSSRDEALDVSRRGRRSTSGTSCQKDPQMDSSRRGGRSSTNDADLDVSRRGRRSTDKKDPEMDSSRRGRSRSYKSDSGSEDLDMETSRRGRRSTNNKDPDMDNSRRGRSRSYKSEDKKDPEMDNSRRGRSRSHKSDSGSADWETELSRRTDGSRRSSVGATSRSSDTTRSRSMSRTRRARARSYSRTRSASLSRKESSSDKAKSILGGDHFDKDEEEDIEKLFKTDQKQERGTMLEKSVRGQARSSGHLSDDGSSDGGNFSPRKTRSNSTALNRFLGKERVAPPRSSSSSLQEGLLNDDDSNEFDCAASLPGDVAEKPRRSRRVPARPVTNKSALDGVINRRRSNRDSDSPRSHTSHLNSSEFGVKPDSRPKRSGSSGSRQLTNL